MKVIIAGGGTGGHIFPAVAIANAVQAMHPGADILFVGAKGKMEMEKVPQAGYPIVGLDIVGLNRSNWLKNLSLPIKLWKSRRKAQELIRSFQPDIVIGVGGFASFPMLNAAQSAGIPTLIQEQNSFAGKSNKLLGRKARAICVAYDGMEQFFPKNAVIKTGNPVRASIAQADIAPEAGRSFFGLNQTQKTLLIVGGSLGAKAINEAIAAHIGELCATGLQIIWQTGKPFYEEAVKAAAPYTGQVKVHAFIREMEQAYAAADLVISRAGALAIAELCIVAKPVIFVPYPFAAEDHQTSNAKALTQKNAALMIKNEDAQEQLTDSLLALLQNEAQQLEMHQNLKQEAIKDADQRIAQIVSNIVSAKQ